MSRVGRIRFAVPTILADQNRNNPFAIMSGCEQKDSSGKCFKYKCSNTCIQEGNNYLMNGGSDTNASAIVQQCNETTCNTQCGNTNDCKSYCKKEAESCATTWYDDDDYQKVELS